MLVILFGSQGSVFATSFASFQFARLICALMFSCLGGIVLFSSVEGAAAAPSPPKSVVDSSISVALSPSGSPVSGGWLSSFCWSSASAVLLSVSVFSSAVLVFPSSPIIDAEYAGCARSRSIVSMVNAAFTLVSVSVFVFAVKLSPLLLLQS